MSEREQLAMLLLDRDTEDMSAYQLADLILDSKWLRDHDTEVRRKTRSAVSALILSVDERAAAAILNIDFGRPLTEDDIRRAHEIRKILDEGKTDGTA